MGLSCFCWWPSNYAESANRDIAGCRLAVVNVSIIFRNTVVFNIIFLLLSVQNAFIDCAFKVSQYMFGCFLVRFTRVGLISTKKITCITNVCSSNLCSSLAIICRRSDESCFKNVQKNTSLRPMSSQNYSMIHLHRHKPLNFVWRNLTSQGERSKSPKPSTLWSFDIVSAVLDFLYIHDKYSKELCPSIKSFNGTTLASQRSHSRVMIGPT